MGCYRQCYEDNVTLWATRVVVALPQVHTLSKTDFHETPIFRITSLYTNTIYFRPIKTVNYMHFS